MRREQIVYECQYGRQIFSERFSAHRPLEEINVCHFQIEKNDTEVLNDFGDYFERRIIKSAVLIHCFCIVYQTFLASKIVRKKSIP